MSDGDDKSKNFIIWTLHVIAKRGCQWYMMKMPVHVDDKVIACVKQICPLDVIVYMSIFNHKNIVW